MHSNDVELQFYEAGHLERLQAFRLPEQQEQFTALPVGMLEKTGERHPIVIMGRNEPVGFFVLHSGEKVKEYAENPNAMLLSAFSIDYAEQGKGYAKKGMGLLKRFVNRQFAKCDEIVLAVNRGNIPAQKLYEKAGFTDTGRRRTGPNGEQLVMSLAV
ncbi:GNAT family N-acetyltransferase [Paenibacillus sp. GYB003]|uniref:GNAT family N-acetyltransferase n=1 Tax=Paenibacillus sp. GYB003 TaxID=2994392 RepID=UPI002F96E303